MNFPWSHRTKRLSPLGKPPFPKRRRTPTVLQMEAVECGAAALAIVLGYYGRIVSLEELRLACGVSRDGSKASNVLKAARDYGLIGKGFTKELAELLSVPLPCIVFWNFNHFLVVEGFSKDGQTVYLNDPAAGPRSAPADEFDQSFTGVVLSFVPAPEFRKGGEKRSLIAGLRTRLRGSRAGLAFVVLAGLALVIPGLVIPTFSQIFIDQILIQGRMNWLGALLIGMALTGVLRMGLTWLEQYYLMRLDLKLSMSTSSAFFWHVLHLPSEFFKQRYGGEIGSRVGINDWVAQILSGQLATTILNLFMVVFFAILLFQYSVALTLAGIAEAALNIIALRYFSRKRVDLSRQLQQDGGKLTAASMSGLQMIETLKATGGEADFFARWSGFQSKVVNLGQRLSVFNMYSGAFPAALSSLNAAVVLTFGGYKIMQGEMSVGMLVAFQSLMASFTGPFNAIVGLGGTLQEAEGAMNRIDDVLYYKKDPLLEGNGAADRPRPASVKLSGRLALKNVSFGFSRFESPLIVDFNLRLEPGQRIALVGASGSGKSTLSQLVCGLYEPWSGEILFDDVPRRCIARDLLSNSLALVDQDIFLFEGTIRDNLTLWDDTIPESWIIAAAKDACIHDDICSRPGAYDGYVAEGGANFSGGQRQRLEIARALVGNPSLLVLDEATSALDPLTEQIIDQNLRRRGCACLIVAHRLSTIRDCDEIILLQRGQAIQRGAHDQLFAVEGPYRELIKSE